MRIKAARHPRIVRVEQYPSMPDQMDAVFKGFKAIAASGLIQLPVETLAWLAAVDKVKAENPVPTLPMVEKAV